MKTKQLYGWPGNYMHLPETAMCFILHLDRVQRLTNRHETEYLKAFLSEI